MLGEPVNLREQQDAVEFFMSLIEIVDEALKALNHELTMSKILGGLFSDQKICKTCPHRYKVRLAYINKDTQILGSTETVKIQMPRSIV